MIWRARGRILGMPELSETKIDAKDNKVAIIWIVTVKVMFNNFTL